MNNNTNGAAFFVFICLAMTIFAVTGANAQVNLPTTGPEVKEIESSDILGEISGYTPHSSLYKGTMETMTSNVDVFMSALDFSDVKMQKRFFYGGIDENGVNLGYAQKLGSAYLGISYAGSLIDEVLRRMTNQEILTLQKRETIKKDSSGTSTTPKLVDTDGQGIEGITTSENTVGLILGAGVFGLKLGFSSYMQGREIESENQNYEHSFESSLKPSLELGWNFPIGSVQTKIALRGAYDMHQYISITGDTIYFMPAAAIESSFVKKEMYQDFTEPSAGFTLGFGFAVGKNTRAEIDLIGDAAYRMYKSNERDGILTTWGITDTNSSTTPVTTNTDITAPEIFDLRISGSPVFALTKNVSDMLTIGGKLDVAIGYDIFTISQSVNEFTIDAITGDKSLIPVSDVTISDSRLSITPKLGIGTKFTLWPDHFTMYAGFGIDIFSYSEIISAHTTTIGGVDTEITNTLRTVDLPTTKITAGLTLNLTPNTALDLLAITSGLDIDETKLTILLTFNK
ncbi:MAG: hypothetical protein LBP80_05495 [Treponema sp.]|jgi:hypothetical protein|nr:hypothetical protein [Treponema sp.]